MTPRFLSSAQLTPWIAQVGVDGNVNVVPPCKLDELYKAVPLPPFTDSSETFKGDAALTPVMDIAGEDANDEGVNFRLTFILALGVTLVIVEHPACCIVSPNVGAFC